MSVRPPPLRVSSTAAEGTPRPVLASRDWRAVLQALADTPAPGLDASWQMTDAMLADVRGVEPLARLVMPGARTVTERGLRALAGHPSLRHLDLSGTTISDAVLDLLPTLPALESVSLAWTRVTDKGMAALGRCARLRAVDLTGTSVGDAAVHALAGLPSLSSFHSGSGLTNDGLAALRGWPVFRTWQGGEASMGLLRYDAGPNYLSLRGPFDDAGLAHLQALEGLFALNLDARDLAITAEGIASLVSLPRLGWLAVDAKDDWMPFIASMPNLRFLGAQDTVASDDGFTALSRSGTLEYIWGRRCHNLQGRGFVALSQMPSLRALSVSCLNVDDDALGALPQFPALRELMPMDVPDAGYRHIGRCERLETLILMYSRNTTDAATRHLAGLSALRSYFNSYTHITDRTPEMLARLETLERVTFDECHRLTDAGIAHLARLPRLAHLRVHSRHVTPAVRQAFGAGVEVDIEP
jgi:hypothetical protein